jgi:phage regulator Rha-like protein
VRPQFEPVIGSLKITEKFEMEHKHVLRELKKNLKHDITKFGLALLMLYIYTPKARLISAEILYRFFILKTYLSDMNENQIGAIRGHYRKKMN